MNLLMMPNGVGCGIDGRLGQYIDAGELVTVRKSFLKDEPKPQTNDSQE